MKQLYNTVAEKYYKLSDKDLKYLVELDTEYGAIYNGFNRGWDTKNVLNIDDEFKKFIELKNRGVKYYPLIKLHENKLKEMNLLQRAKDLLFKFTKFDCFLSKYYIELLDPMVKKIEMSLGKRDVVWYTTYQGKGQTPSLVNYYGALKMLKENPYEDIDDAAERNINATLAKKIIEDTIDELGYKWKVIINPDMLPRMCVDSAGFMCIRTDAKFSKIDMEGLIEHEIKGHVGRRYYGRQLGLNLFVYGLLWKNTLDEGLAIWNSLHKCKHPKPNIKFNIALKTIIAYQLDKLDFCELFDFCKKLAPEVPDKSLFVNIVRFKREIQDCSIIGGNGDDLSYYCGYLIVKKMDDKGRDDILKYNVGPGQIKQIPELKEFFKYNKIKPIED